MINIPNNHYFPRHMVAQWRKKQGQDTCVIMDKNFRREDRNATSIFSSSKYLSRKMDEHIYKMGSRYDIDGITLELRKQIEFFLREPRIGIAFNRTKLAILGYTLFEVNPRNYSIFGNMDFFINQEDPQYSFFLISDIHVVTPISLNRTFIIADTPITSYSPNGYFRSTQKIKIDSIGKEAAIIVMVGDADYYFLLPIHPKFMIVYHYRTEMIKRKFQNYFVPLHPLTDFWVTKYNLLIFHSCYNYVLGLEKEFDRLENHLI